MDRISQPIQIPRRGLAKFSLAAAMSVIGAAASLLRGGRFVHDDEALDQIDAVEETVGAAS